MAFNTNDGKQAFTATAAQTDFNFNFKIFAGTDLNVYQNGTLLTITTHYTVTIDGDNGGTVSLVSGATLNDAILLVRDLPAVRTTDYQTGGDLLEGTLDDDQDYQTYLIADERLASNQHLRLSEAAQGINTELPAPVALQAIRVNADADGFDFVAIGGTETYLNIANVDTIAELPIAPTIETYNVRGYYAAGDGGGGVFNYDATVNRSTANGGTVIDATGTGAGLGCWIRQYTLPLDIRCFGASTSSADNYSHILAALTAVKNISINDGVYIVGTTIPQTSISGITISGDGELKIKDATAIGMQILSLNSCDDVSIKGVIFNGNKANVTQPDLAGSWNSGAPRKYYTPIDLQTCTNVDISECLFYDVPTSAINIENSDTVRITSNTFKNSYMDPIFTITKGTNKNVHINKNTITNMTYTFPYANGMIVNADNVTITENTIDTVDRTGIKPFDQSCSNAVVANNTIKNCGFQGINPQSGYNIKIIGNSISLCASNGIYLSEAVAGYGNIKVIGNECFDNDTVGIYMENCNDIEVSLNQCFDTRAGGARTQTIGIQLNTNNVAPMDNIKISSNQCRNNTTNGIYLVDPGSQGLSNIDVTNNTVLNNDTYGIRTAIGSNSTNIKVNDNIFDGNGTDMVIDGTAFIEHDRNTFTSSSGIIKTIPSLDTTPTITGGGTFKTANAAATTISNFLGGRINTEIRVVINDANTTLDFTASSLKGNNGVDYVAALGDSIRAFYDGTYWYCDIVQG